MKGIQICSNEGPALFLGEIINKNTLTKLKKYYQEPLDQFQPNLTQSILGWKEFKFVQMKGPTVFQVEIIIKLRKYIDEIQNSSSLEPLANFN